MNNKLSFRYTNEIFQCQISIIDTVLFGGWERAICSLTSRHNDLTIRHYGLTSRHYVLTSRHTYVNFVLPNSEVDVNLSDNDVDLSYVT